MATSLWFFDTPRPLKAPGAAAQTAASSEVRTLALDLRHEMTWINRIAPSRAYCGALGTGRLKMDQAVAKLLDDCTAAYQAGADFPTIWRDMLSKHPLVGSLLPISEISDADGPIISVTLIGGDRLLFNGKFRVVSRNLHGRF